MSNYGTLYLCGISDLKKFSDTRHKFFIARYVKNADNVSNYGFIRLPDLAPPQALVDQYLEYKAEGKWNVEMFNNWYVPQFEHLIRTDANMRGSLNYVWKLLKQNDVVLGCYCPDKDLCHRTIIGKAYEKLGFTVVYA